MPEAYGNVVLKVNDDILSKLRGCERTIPTELIIQLLNDSNIDSTQFNESNNIQTFDRWALDLDLRHGLSLQTSPTVKSGYIGLEIFGSDWMGCTYLLASCAEEIEIYASIGDEYGTRLNFALNDLGKRHLFGWEEEGDEFDQEDFDEDEYEELVLKKENEWRDFIPKIVQKSFPSIVE